MRLAEKVLLVLVCGGVVAGLMAPAIAAGILADVYIAKGLASGAMIATFYGEILALGAVVNWWERRPKRDRRCPLERMLDKEGRK